MGPHEKWAFPKHSVPPAILDNFCYRFANQAPNHSNSFSCLLLDQASQNKAVLSKKQFQGQTLPKTASEPRKTKILEFTEKPLFVKNKTENAIFCQKKPFLGVLGQERAYSLKNLFFWSKRAQKRNFFWAISRRSCAGIWEFCAGICPVVRAIVREFAFVREFWKKKKTLQWLILCVFALTFCVFGRCSEILKKF